MAYFCSWVKALWLVYNRMEPEVRFYWGDTAVLWQGRGEDGHLWFSWLDTLVWELCFISK